MKINEVSAAVPFDDNKLLCSKYVIESGNLRAPIIRVSFTGGFPRKRPIGDQLQNHRGCLFAAEVGWVFLKKK